MPYELYHIILYLSKFLLRLLFFIFGFRDEDILRTRSMTITPGDVDGWMDKDISLQVRLVLIDYSLSS